MLKLYQRIKEERIKRGMTQDELAKGITPFYCAFCENAFVAKTKKRTKILNECGKSAAFYFWT